MGFLRWSVVVGLLVLSVGLGSGVGAGSSGVSCLAADASALEQLLSSVRSDYGETGFSERDAFREVLSASVRVRAGGSCGSGCVVGVDPGVCGYVLTNAHVVGSQSPRSLTVERWDSLGRSARSGASVVRYGYRAGMSLDYALLRVPFEFVSEVRPVPLRRDTDFAAAPLITVGSPRCEWPSLQVLRFVRESRGMVYWLPEAIGGRSGSAVVQLTSVGPRVVGLLTWRGGGHGIGQSSAFLLSAIAGRSVPVYALEPGVRLASSESGDCPGGRCPRDGGGSIPDLDGFVESPPRLFPPFSFDWFRALVFGLVCMVGLLVLLAAIVLVFAAWRRRRRRWF